MGWRLELKFAWHGELLHILLRYTSALISPMSQTAACNRPSLGGPAAVPLTAFGISLSVFEPVRAYRQCASRSRDGVT